MIIAKSEPYYVLALNIAEEQNNRRAYQREISSTSLVLLKWEFHCPKMKDKMSV